MIDFDDEEFFDFESISDEELEDDIEESAKSDRLWLEEEKTIFSTQRNVPFRNQENDSQSEPSAEKVEQTQEEYLYQLLLAEARKHFSQVKLIQLEMAMKMIPFFATAINSTNDRRKQAGIRGLKQINSLYPELMELFNKINQ
jgi:hypothetical protein